VTIDQKFIDFDFENVPLDQRGLLVETEDQIMEASQESGVMLASFEDTYPQLMVPRGERKERALRNRDKWRSTVARIYSQGRTSACVGFGSAQALETTRTRRYGVANHVPLSGMSVYKEIGRTLMSGAYISDGMKQIVSTGALPLDTPENRGKFNLVWGLQDWSSRFPSGWEKNANPFRVAKWATARGSDEIESALINGFTGIVGRSRHCVPYVYLDYDGNSPYASYANSWGNWGDKGFGYDSKRVYGDLTLYLILEVVVSDDLEIPSL